MDKLGNILPRVLRKQPAAGRLIEAQVASAFRGLLGEPASLCDEIDLHSGTLVVTTSSPALAHQLRLDSDTIIERLNALNLGRRVRTVRVRIGRSTPAS